VSETAIALWRCGNGFCSSCSRCCGPSPCRARRLGRALGLAAAATALAYVIYFRRLHGGSTNLIPVSAIMLGASMLGERLGCGTSSA